MTRSRLSLALAGVALAAGAAVASTAATAAPGGGACQLNGTADFVNGPNTSAHDFTYGFRGALTTCKSNVSAPASGVISAGKTITIGGVDYQEPAATGTGDCASNSTAGTAVVQWVDGTITLLDYTTTSAGAAVVLQATVRDTLTVFSSTGSRTITTTQFAGATAKAALAFEASPVDCAGAGVSSAGIAGVAGIGTTA